MAGCQLWSSPGISHWALVYKARVKTSLTACVHSCSAPGSATPPLKWGQKNWRCFSFSFQTKCELFGKRQTPSRRIGSDRMEENGTDSFSMRNHGMVEESTEGIFSNRSTVRPSQPGLGQLFTGASWYSFKPCYYILCTHLGFNLTVISKFVLT